MSLCSYFKPRTNVCQENFVEAEGSDWVGRSESLPAQGLLNHFNGWDIDEAPGSVPVGSSRNATRENPWFYVLTIHPDRGGTDYTQLLCLFLRKYSKENLSIHAFRK